MHIHTCLSPCAEAEMAPAAIARMARVRGLDIIGICDHNSAENVAAAVRAGRKEEVFVVPGIEITSREEVHILGLFHTEADALDVQALVYESLAGENDEIAFGTQLVVDEWDRMAGTSNRLLIGATELTLEDVVGAIHRHGGLAIASHIDRQGFGIIGQLGFVPPELELDALEVSPRSPFKEWESYRVITSSDAHVLEDIGRSRTSFFTRGASLDE
ncbi:MAG: histidinol phosphatase, partial [Planctomycetes bacterium]|nr:histidinol phosphatase [Planctomycetota bacterium]